MPINDDIEVTLARIAKGLEVANRIAYLDKFGEILESSQRQQINKTIRASLGLATIDRTETPED